MRQEQGQKTKHKGIYRLSDGTFRIVAKPIDPRTLKPKYIEKLTRQKYPDMTENAAVAWRAQMIDEVKNGTSSGDVPSEIPRLSALCSSSWISFVTENVGSEGRVKKLGNVLKNVILDRWGDYLISKIAVPEIDAWVRSITVKYGPETVRHYVGLFRRIMNKARGQYELPAINWDLVTLPKVTTEHAERNRLDEELIAKVMPIVAAEFPFYAPEIFALYTLGIRYCHASGMEYAKLSADGVVAIDRTYDGSANTFGPIDKKKKAPPLMAFEPRTLELVRAHRRYLMEKGCSRALNTGLLSPSETGTRPVGNDQLNDVWREAQEKAGIDEDRRTTVHGLRHTFHDVARRQGVPDAVVKAMAGRSGVEVTQTVRGSDKHLHYSRGVTIDEMLEASIKVMSVVPVTGAVGSLADVGTGPRTEQSRDQGRDQRSRDWTSDDEGPAAITG